MNRPALALLLAGAAGLTATSLGAQERPVFREDGSVELQGL